MTPLEQLRASQHNETVVASEVAAWDWLNSRTLDDVLGDLTTRMTPVETAQLAQIRRDAA